MAKTVEPMKAVKYESDSENEIKNQSSDGSDPSANPLASKSIDNTRAMVVSSPMISTATKRPAGEKDSMDNKRSKKKVDVREAEEIVILKGMADYLAKKKANPYVEIDPFHDSIKEKLEVVMSSVQLKEKIKRLKKKYINNKNKEITKPHQVKVHELSEKVWGDDAKKNVFEIVISKANVSSGVTARILSIGETLFEGDKGVEGKEDWKSLRVMENELYLKKGELMRAKTKIVLDALKSTGM